MSAPAAPPPDVQRQSWLESERQEIRDYAAVTRLMQQHILGPHGEVLSGGSSLKPPMQIKYLLSLNQSDSKSERRPNKPNGGSLSSYITPNSLSLSSLLSSM